LDYPPSDASHFLFIDVRAPCRRDENGERVSVEADAVVAKSPSDDETGSRSHHRIEHQLGRS
jgi:hypothetical protein